MNNVSTIVFSHADAIDAINRHIPIWKTFTDNLLIVSPKDNPVSIQDIDCLSVEKREHHGPNALKRHLFAMKSALSYESDYYVFLEYDAMMLKRPEPRAIIQGNLFNEGIFSQKKQEDMAKGECFLHFPWIFPKNKLKDFVEIVDLSVENNATYHKNYAHDIWIIQKLMKHDFDVHNLLCKNRNTQDEACEGFSNNSFDTPERISEAISYVQKGAYAIHGIKSEEVLHKVLEASNQSHLLIK